MYTQQDRKGGWVMVACPGMGGVGRRAQGGSAPPIPPPPGEGRGGEREGSEGRREGGRHLLICFCRSLY